MCVILVASKMGKLRFWRWMEPVWGSDHLSLNNWIWLFKLISGNVVEPLNQVRREIQKNFEHIQNNLVLGHHHWRSQVSHHGPGPGGQEGVNSIISFKKSTPQTWYSMANANHGGKIHFWKYLDKSTFSLSTNLLGWTWSCSWGTWITWWQWEPLKQDFSMLWGGHLAILC